MEAEGEGEGETIDRRSSGTGGGAGRFRPSFEGGLCPVPLRGARARVRGWPGGAPEPHPRPRAEPHEGHEGSPLSACFSPASTRVT